MPELISEAAFATSTVPIQETRHLEVDEAYDARIGIIVRSVNPQKKAAVEPWFKLQRRRQ